MKVAHLIDSVGLYGAEQVLLTLCKEQQAQGLKPVIVSCGLPNEEAKPIEKAAREQGVDLIVWRMAAGLNVRSARELIAHLREKKVNLLHSHGYKFNILLGILGRTKIGMPLVSTVHGYVKAKFPKKMWVYELLDRVFLKRFDAIVLVSKKMREIPAFRKCKKIHVIENGISGSSSLPKSLLEAKVYQLLAIGRLSPEKGFDYLIRAIAELNRNATICKLTIFGDGGLRDSLLALIDDLGQKDNITLAGFVADAQQHFHKYQLIVMPSLTEGIPVTLLEAMRNQTPIIATSVGGIPEVVGPNYQFIMKSASVSAVVKKVSEWFSTAEAHKREIVEDNYRCFSERFSAEKMADRYMNLYASVISAGREQ
jgi:glycosyltransferase involved in cell wall biosynthesis